MRVLGLDVGSKTIGVAMSDPTGLIAQGIRTIDRGHTTVDCDILDKMVREQGVETIVVGLPFNMDGSEGPMAANVRTFVREMQKIIQDIPVVFWDERLSTVAAERSLLEADLSRAKRRKVINQMAAAFILQGYLDANQFPITDDAQND